MCVWMCVCVRVCACMHVCLFMLMNKLAIYNIFTYPTRVVHHTCVVIWNIVIVNLWVIKWFEVILNTRYYILALYGDKIISIWALHFMPESNGVSHFMNNNAFLQIKDWN